MNPFDTLGALIDNPAVLAGPERPQGLGRTGLLGYFAGTLGLFAFLRMNSAVPPGIMSFTAVFTFILAANFFFAGVIHLFLDLTGVRGAASGLFLAFGCSDFLLALLVPLGFIAKLEILNGFLLLCLCLAAVVYARVRLIRRLYPVSVSKALLSIWLPYAGLGFVFFAAFIYSIAWLVWLVI